MESWRGRLAVMASRGEVDGPRMEEARAALSYWQFKRQLDRAVTGGLLDQGLADEAEAKAREYTMAPETASST